MTKARELRDMGDEQIRLVWKDAAETLFRLRLQAQTEKLASPAVVKKHRRTIARCQTILSQRGTLVAAPAPGETVQQGSHAKTHGAGGRAKPRARAPGAAATRRTVRKRTQSGK